MRDKPRILDFQRAGAPRDLDVVGAADEGRRDGGAANATTPAGMTFDPAIGHGKRTPGDAVVVQAAGEGVDVGVDPLAQRREHRRHQMQPVERTIGRIAAQIVPAPTSADQPRRIAASARHSSTQVAVEARR